MKWFVFLQAVICSACDKSTVLFLELVVLCSSLEQWLEREKRGLENGSRLIGLFTSPKERHAPNLFLDRYATVRPVIGYTQETGLSSLWFFLSSSFFSAVQKRSKKRESREELQPRLLRSLLSEIHT